MRAPGRPRVGAPAGVLATLVAVLAATVLTAGGAGAVSRGWTVSLELPPPVADVESVACATATVCVAVGYSTNSLGLQPSPLELRTADAGAVWAPVAVPHADPSLDAVACSGSLCVAGGNGTDVLRSDDDGLTWSSVALPSGLSAVTAAACPSASACYVEGNGTGEGPSGLVAASADGGQSWSTVYDETTTYLRTLWCEGPTDCFAYGAGTVATTDGTDWASTPEPSDFPSLAVCPTASECVGSSPAAGIVVSEDGGETWTGEDGSVVPLELACGSAASCVGTDGTNVVTTDDGGSTWSEQTPSFTEQVLTGAACVSATDCQVVGSATANGYQDRALLLDVDPSQASITPELAGDAVDAAIAASCPTSSVCDVAAVDPYGNPVLLRTADAGSAWQLDPLPAALGQLDAVRCTSSSACLLGGGDLSGDGAVWWTSDAGAVWSAARVPGSVGEVDGIWCVTASRCEAIGYLVNSWTAVLSSTNGGRSWSVTPMPHTATDLFGVDCASVLDCVVVGGRAGAVGVAFETTDGGRQWRPARVLGGVRALNGVACTSASTCLAGAEVRKGASVHAVVARTTDGGASWTPVSVPGRAANTLAVACVSASVCEAVGVTTTASDAADPNDAFAAVSSNAGRSWTAQALPADQWALYAVACARSGACAAAGTGSFEAPQPPAGATVLRLG